MFIFPVYAWLCIRGAMRLLELCVALLYFRVYLHILYKSQDCLIPFPHATVSITRINPSSAFKYPHKSRNLVLIRAAKGVFLNSYSGSSSCFRLLLVSGSEGSLCLKAQVLEKPVWHRLPDLPRPCSRVTSIGHSSVVEEQTLGIRYTLGGEGGL